MKNKKKKLLIHDPDGTEITRIHRQNINKKKFLKNIYLEWYNIFKSHVVNTEAEKLLEIGSGGGFLKEVIPSVITSDIANLEYCDITFDTYEMPFKERSVSRIFLLNVFHHIDKPEKFLNEVNRVLKKDGKLIMLEPSISIWSRLIYKYLHFEAMDPKSGWEIQGGKRLSNANIALPWIVFVRDYEKFCLMFPDLKIEKIEHLMPFSYILSGGVSSKFSLPAFLYKPIRQFEKLFKPIDKHFSMFQTIVIKKIK
ncbi:MAG: class I SAM-dependent methyltransferase [Pseudomonadota bacterium]